MFSRFVFALAAAALLSCAAPAAAAPPIKHVFVIVLENEDYDTIFGPDTPSPYLGRVLPAKGALLTNYYATAHVSLSNYLTMISGQPPTPANISDCQAYVDVTQGGAPAPVDASGIAKGDGCIYPPAVQTIAGQLARKHLSWRGYMEDMGNDPAREASTCARPAPGGSGVLRATPTDAYVYRHNPFIYFHSVTDDVASCSAHVVRLENLSRDLRRIGTTPNYAFITPSVCNDGHDKPCKDGRAGGLVTADAWLKLWVPRILASPAFKKDGLLIVTFDEAKGDSTACCNEPSGPNVTAPGGNGPGGGRIGAVLLSRFIKPGSIVTTPVNHYGMLRGVEDIFGLPHLGYAADPALATFASAFARP
jgi:phosphatidylinositol-3-phosphatase